MELAALIEQAVDLTTRSLSLQKDGQDDAAHALLDQALALQPLFLPALQSKVGLLTRQDRYDEAMFSVSTAFALAPHSARLVSLRRQLQGEAARRLRERLQINPQDADALFQRGNLALCDGKLLDALLDFERVLAIDANHRAARNNLGNALLALNRTEEALNCYDRVLASNPDDVSAWFNRGNALQQLNQLHEALDCFAHTMQLRPDLAEARMEMAHCLLRAGEYSAGWPYLEARWQTAQMAPLRLSSNAPQWSGEALKGKSILLWAEQGLGDAIQFSRFVPEVAAHAKRTYLRCPRSLHGLFQQLDPLVKLLTEEEPLPAHDLHCPLMSLPLALGKTLQNLNAPAAYLHAPAERIAHWKNRLGPNSRPRIGICWHGRQQGTRNVTRDMPLTALQPLLALDAEFVVVQKEISDADNATLAIQPNVRIIGPSLDDLADTAALMSCLDLVVSVDTVIAHLAGAIGRPCHLLLRSFGEWRWLAAGTQSPWYPSLRLYRQECLGDWSTPVASLITALNKNR